MGQRRERRCAQPALRQTLANYLIYPTLRNRQLSLQAPVSLTCPFSTTTHGEKIGKIFEEHPEKFCDIMQQIILL